MSKRAGAVPEKTREWILNAAEKEFAEHGFQGSSLRQICAEAGVTTGALYFFFEGKDDLFRAVLLQVTEPFQKLMHAHYEQERGVSRRRDEHGLDADFEISRQLISFYFKNERIWQILAHHLSHPVVREFLDGFIDDSTEHYICLLQQASGREPEDRFAIHQYVHMQVDTMLTLISHGFSQEEMIGHAQTVVRMLRGAFQVLVSG